MPVRFLHALARAVAALALYEAGHPAREHAIDAAYDALLRLLETRADLRFTFLDGDVLCGSEPLRELGEWDWGSRLSGAGIQRLEFAADVTREELDELLEEISRRLTFGGASSAEQRQTRMPRIRFGTAELAGDRDVDTRVDEDAAQRGVPRFTYPLTEEAETVQWVHDEVQSKQLLHLGEAEAIVRSLTVAMHGDREMLIPLMRLREFDEYTTTHALNVSVLAMALTEFLGLPPRDVRTFGVAGLLHDIGKVKIPREILTKPGKLTDEERAIINSHTVEGARIIIQTQDQLDLAAVVAYEHHVMIDGGGYPDMRFRRECHYASRIVHVCDVYDALRTKRPYRDAWEAARVISYIDEKAGTEFDARIAEAFIRMMQKWEGRVARVTLNGDTT